MGRAARDSAGKPVPSSEPDGLTEILATVVGAGVSALPALRSIASYCGLERGARPSMRGAVELIAVGCPADAHVADPTLVTYLPQVERLEPGGSKLGVVVVLTHLDDETASLAAVARALRDQEAPTVAIVAVPSEPSREATRDLQMLEDTLDAVLRIPTRGSGRRWPFVPPIGIVDWGLALAARAILLPVASDQTCTVDFYDLRTMFPTGACGSFAAGSASGVGRAVASVDSAVGPSGRLFDGTALAEAEGLWLLFEGGDLTFAEVSEAGSRILSHAREDVSVAYAPCFNDDMGSEMRTVILSAGPARRNTPRGQRIRAETAARRLLEALLPDQAPYYQAHGFIEVASGLLPDTRYRIHRGSGWCHVEVELEGRVVTRQPVGPRDEQSTPSERVLAEFSLIRQDEKEYLGMLRTDGSEGTCVDRGLPRGPGWCGPLVPGQRLYFLPGRGELLEDPLGRLMTGLGFGIHGREMILDFARLRFGEQLHLIQADLEAAFWSRDAALVGRSYGAYLLLHALALMTPFPGRILLLSPVLGTGLAEDGRSGSRPPRAERLAELADRRRFPVPYQLEIHTGAEDRGCDPLLATRFAQGLPNTRLCIVAGAGHDLGVEYLRGVLASSRV